MNMVFKQRQYVRGEIVGRVDIEAMRGPFEVPMPKRWYVLLTHPNCEGKVMRTFHQRNISAYFPTVRERRRITVRRRGYSFDVVRDVRSPLFAGVILIPDFQARLGGVHDVEGVDRYFRMDQCYPYLDETGIARVRWLEGLGNIPVARRRRLFRIGQLVRITDGPFALFNGIVDRLDSRGRLTVLVDIFKRMTPIAFDEGQIEPA
jgi:transcription termination/antitermination protein NusG